MSSFMVKVLDAPSHKMYITLTTTIAVSVPGLRLNKNLFNPEKMILLFVGISRIIICVLD